MALWRREDPSAIADYLVPAASKAFQKTQRFMVKKRLGIWGTKPVEGSIDDLKSLLLEASSGKRSPAEPEAGGEAEEVVASIEVLGCGTFLTDVEKTMGEDGRPIYSMSGADLDLVTDSIPLEEGLCFGFMFRLNAEAGRGLFELEAVFRHPEFLDPYSGLVETETRAALRAIEGEVGILAFGFHEAYVMVEGAWTMELWYDGRLMASHDFEVVAKG